MSDQTPENRGSRRPDDPFDERLHRLEQRLKAQNRADAEGGGKAKPSNEGFAQALKLGSEFVAGILVGAAIGYGIDRVVGTTPFGMIVFLMLGFAAGVLNVLRSQGVVADPRTRLPRSDRDAPQDGGSGPKP